VPSGLLVDCKPSAQQSMCIADPLPSTKRPQLLRHVGVCAVACSQLQRVRDWAVKMRNPEVPYSTIEECARHADIIGVSAAMIAVLVEWPLFVFCFKCSLR